MTNDELISAIGKNNTLLIDEHSKQWIVDIIPDEARFFYLLLEAIYFGKEANYSFFVWDSSRQSKLFVNKEYKKCLDFIREQFADKKLPRAQMFFSDMDPYL